MCCGSVVRSLLPLCGWGLLRSGPPSVPTLLILTMSRIKVITWNVRGKNSAFKRLIVFIFLRRFSPHICILQETHFLGSRVLGLRRAYARGVSILIHRSLQFQLLEVKTDPDGRYVLLHALMLGVIVDLCLPPPADVKLLYSIMHLVTSFEVPNVLIAGDFNLTSTPDLDCLHSSLGWSLGLPQWRDTFSLSDVWRCFHPSARDYTCHSATHRTFSRIGFVRGNEMG